MMKTITKALYSMAFIALANSAFAEKGEQWLTDMDQAQKVAKAEGKDILMFFTGSDWCGWCIRLDNEVFSKHAFLSYAKDNLVLVDLDFPSDDELISEEQRAHNEEWKDKFPVQGFPSVFLTDSSANAYASTGYKSGGADKYVTHLKELTAGKVASAKLAAKADKASGVERAQLLAQILSDDSAVINDRNAKMAEIIKLSKGKDDTLYNKYYGIKASNDMKSELRTLRRVKRTPEESLAGMLSIFKKYDFLKEGDAVHSILGTIGDQFIKMDKADEGVAFMDSVMTNDSYPLDVRQSTALFKGIIVANVEEKNVEKAIIYLDQAAAMDPDSRSAQRALKMKKSLSKS